MPNVHYALLGFAIVGVLTSIMVLALWWHEKQNPPVDYAYENELAIESYLRQMEDRWDERDEEARESEEVGCPG